LLAGRCAFTPPALATVVVYYNRESEISNHFAAGISARILL
jgi:hypothetical protein